MLTVKTSPSGADVVEISPFGAAIVEAMPDRKRMALVRRMFRNKKCFDSELFTIEQLEQWYACRGQQIAGINRGMKTA